MFAKSNPKGMALLVHTLLCLFDQEEFQPLFSVCWFPYTMVELKEFKSIALQISENLAREGRLQGNASLTKAVLETASGVKMWQTLRNMSDYCILDRLNKEYSKGELKTLPCFV
jgi:hypothetical protein